MAEPSKEFLRYGEVQDWLAGAEVGISREESRQMISLGIIPITHMPGRKNGRAYYRKSQIKEKLKL